MSMPNSRPDEAMDRLVGAIRAVDAARGLRTLHGSIHEVLGPRYSLEYPKSEREELGRVLDAAEPERAEAVLRRLWSEKRAREAGTLSAWRSRMTGVMAALRRLDDRQAATVASLGTSGKVLAAVGSALNRAADAAKRAGRPLDGDAAYVGMAVMAAIEEAVAPPPKAKKEGLARVRAILEQVGRLAAAAEKAAGEEGVPCFGGFAAEVERVAGAALAAAEATLNAPPPADPADTASDPADPADTASDPADPADTAPAAKPKRRISG